MKPSDSHSRPRVRRAVVLFPSGLTLLNLFFGMFAIVAATRGEYDRAGWFVVLGGVMDMLDGRVARATNTGGRFGEELDSLVDAITFGVAPSLITFFAVFNHEGWEWLFCFLFTAAAILRLARFNVEQAGTAKTFFQGLPSPAAGITLATYYWFSQTPLYQETVIANLPWHVLLRYIIVALSFLMVSNVPYPVMPNVSLRSVRGIVGLVLVVGGIAALVFLPNQFFFPAGVLYVAFGIVRAAWLGLLDRRGASPTTHTGVVTDAHGRVRHLREEVGDDRQDGGDRRPRRRRSRRRRGERGGSGPSGAPRPIPPSPESTTE
ncbi:MAG TPA: CDP-diacylglycerol--serine O-phosphatidyltransferase [Gemmatimonadaceae bacterium]|nr:CDP-diacylglycerol--serine O-phosphatidyltransferase [Gemmatimonadaceae bacterium]